MIDVLLNRIMDFLKEADEPIRLIALLIIAFSMLLLMISAIYKLIRKRDLLMVSKEEVLASDIAYYAIMMIVFWVAIFLFAPP